MIQLPMECYPCAEGPEKAVRTVTGNISTGGVYFEMDLFDEVPRPAPQDRLHVELTVPPGDGHFPYEGRVTGEAEIIRCDPVRGAAPSRPDLPPRVGVAARFGEPLKLLY